MALDTSNMSDEELLEHMNSLPEEEEEVAPETEEEDTESEEEIEAEEAEDLEDTEEEEDSEEVDDTEEDTLETDETEEVEESDEESQTDEEETEEETNEDTDGDTQETSEVDYKAFYEQVTADYKANGKTMPGLKSPEDFKTALAMASNYALKTTAIKPHLGRIKMLQDVSDAELNEMMDFRNRDPEVIKKALKDAGLDPLDIDVDKPSDYVAKDHSISPAEIEFEEVIETIRDTPEFEQTSTVVTKLWDEKSKEQMLSNPTLIKGLNEEISMGRFDKVQGIIEQRKLLGRTDGLSDLEMYQEIVTQMDMEAQQAATTQQTVETVTPKVKVKDPAVKAAKQKAGIKAKKTSKVVKKHDPVNLSDEEFMALMEQNAKFI